MLGGAKEWTTLMFSLMWSNGMMEAGVEGKVGGRVMSANGWFLGIVSRTFLYTSTE